MPVLPNMPSSGLCFDLSLYRFCKGPALPIERSVLDAASVASWLSEKRSNGQIVM